MSDDDVIKLADSSAEESLVLAVPGDGYDENIFSSKESFAAYQHDIQFNNKLVDKAMGDLLGELDL